MDRDFRHHPNLEEMVLEKAKTCTTGDRLQFLKKYLAELPLEELKWVRNLVTRSKRHVQKSSGNTEQDEDEVSPAAQVPKHTHDNATTSTHKSNPDGTVTSANKTQSQTGETDLSTLLRTMKPTLNSGEYIFASVSDGKLREMDKSKIIGLFREAEGITVIVSRAYGESINLKFDFVAAWITLTVHSSLEASGLTAAFANALAKANISCNVVAAYFHDHIFVPFDKADAALETLTNLSANQK